ncbi:MAG: hypothetical protein GY786_04020 [Proteobacteria bacterium]|nr:hypothetical protein [Pseudomonadota bacterium]
MLHQSLRKKEKPTIAIPAGIAVLVILLIVLTALSALLLDRSGKMQTQQEHMVTLLNNIQNKQQRLEILYSETPEERISRTPEGKKTVPRDEFNKFKKEYIREIKRLRKQIQNLKALL